VGVILGRGEAGEWVASSRLGVYPWFVHKHSLMGRAPGCRYHLRGRFFIRRQHLTRFRFLFQPILLLFSPCFV